MSQTYLPGQATPSNININFHKKTCSQLPAKIAIEIDLCVSAVPQTANFVEQFTVVWHFTAENIAVNYTL